MRLAPSSQKWSGEKTRSGSGRGSRLRRSLQEPLAPELLVVELARRERANGIGSG